MHPCRIVQKKSQKVLLLFQLSLVKLKMPRSQRLKRAIENEIGMTSKRISLNRHPERLLV